MITSMHIDNFRCFKKFHLDLERFNVLIGPNDSGKTAFMQAVRMASAIGHGTITDLAHVCNYCGIKERVEAYWQKDIKLKIRLWAVGPVLGRVPQRYLVIETDDQGRFCPRVEASDLRTPEAREQAVVPEQEAREWYQREIAGAEYYRFAPSSLREESPPHTDPEQFKMTNDQGLGLPSVMEDIGRISPEEGIALQEAFRKRFPSYKKVTVARPRLNALRFITALGAEFSAGAVSDGVMMSLAFLVLCHKPCSPKILLIEEPENSVHHASLKDIVDTLKQLSKEKNVQIILTTHSPYLVDLVEPEEVQVFEKRDDGTVSAKPLTEFPNVVEMKKHFMTGEIWTSTLSHE